MTCQTILPLGSTSMTRLPRVQPIRVLPSSRRIAVKGLSGVFDLPDDLALGGVLADDLVEQLRDEVVAVGQLAGHPGLEVVVLRLGLERDLDDGSSPGGRPRAAAGLSPASVSRIRPSSRGWTVLTSDCVPSNSKTTLPVAVDLDDRAAGVVLALVDGEQDVAVGQDPAVARAVRDSSRATLPAPSRM